jgi:hypothetical protein
MEDNVLSDIKKRIFFLYRGQADMIVGPKLGFSRGLLTGWKAEKSAPGVVHILAVANNTGASAAWILTGKSNSWSEVVDYALFESDGYKNGDSRLVDAIGSIFRDRKLAHDHVVGLSFLMQQMSDGELGPDEPESPYRRLVFGVDEYDYDDMTQPADEKRFRRKIIDMVIDYVAEVEKTLTGKPLCDEAQKVLDSADANYTGHDQSEIESNSAGLTRPQQEVVDSCLKMIRVCEAHIRAAIEDPDWAESYYRDHVESKGAHDGKRRGA